MTSSSGPDGCSSSNSEVLYHFYDPVRIPPACGQFVRLISRLLVGYFESTFAYEIDLAEVLSDGAEEAVRLCNEVRQILEMEPVVLGIDACADVDLAIVGDIHGQFDDLLHSVLSLQLQKRQTEMRGDRGHCEEESTSLALCTSSTPSHATPSEVEMRKTLKFLFLGDYVDRGPRSVEVILLLLALKVEYPNHIFLLRGNHEEAQTSRMYGFYHECLAKLTFPTSTEAFRSTATPALTPQCEEATAGRPMPISPGNVGSLATFPMISVGGVSDASSEPWFHFNTVFCWLPLAAVVRCGAGYCFCTHGGLSPFTKYIHTLQYLPRQEYGGHDCGSTVLLEAINSPEIPSSGDEDGYSSSDNNRLHRERSTSLTQRVNIIDGLLWSDPGEMDGISFNVRGCGYTFGEDMTESFLDANYNISYMPTIHALRHDNEGEADRHGDGGTVHRGSGPRRSEIGADSDSASYSLACLSNPLVGGTRRAGKATPAASFPMLDTTMHFLIRAHQCVRSGYQWTHKDKVLTIFSAPKYCGVNDNRGAIAILRGDEHDLLQGNGQCRINLEFKVYDDYQCPPRTRETSSVKTPLGGSLKQRGSLFTADGATANARKSSTPQRGSAFITNPILQMYFDASESSNANH